MIRELFTNGTVWYVWILWFAVIEGYAVATDLYQGTLTYHIRKWFSVKTAFGRTVFVVFTLALAGWFIPHIIWRYL